MSPKKRSSGLKS